MTSAADVGLRSAHDCSPVLSACSPGRAPVFYGPRNPLEDVFGPAGRRLRDCLSNESSETSLAHLQTFLERRFSGCAADRRFEAAARSARSVAWLGIELGLSERATYSRTIDIAGLTPKRMLRVLRLHRALRHANRGYSWSDVAYCCGYSDQSHLSREFCSLLGEAPVPWQLVAVADLFKTIRERVQ
jgi:AraC-like DNA-binding protein